MNKIPVAIVDDHAMFRRGLAGLLNDGTVADVVLEAGSGEDFLELAPFRKPEIVLLDLTLPRMQGEEVLRRIQRDHPEMKVIILSMHDNESLTLRLMELGASAYLLKESEPEEVEMALQSVREAGYYFNDRVSGIMLRKIMLQDRFREQKAARAEFSERELEVLHLVCKEMTNAEIGERLFISIRTVEGHRKKVQQKLGARNTAGMIVEAIRQGLVELDEL